MWESERASNDMAVARKRIAELEAALKAFAEMWGSADAHSTSKRAQAKRAAVKDE